MLPITLCLSSSQIPPVPHSHIPTASAAHSHPAGSGYTQVGAPALSRKTGSRASFPELQLAEPGKNCSEPLPVQQIPLLPVPPHLLFIPLNSLGFLLGNREHSSVREPCEPQQCPSWRGSTSVFLPPCPPCRTHHVEDPQGHCCCLDVEAAAFGGLRGGLGGHFRVPLGAPEIMRSDLQPPHRTRSESSSASFLLSECVKSSTKSHEAFGFLNHKESKTGGLFEHIQLGNRSPSAVSGTGCQDRTIRSRTGLCPTKILRNKTGARNFTSNSPCCFCSEASKFLPLELVFPASKGSVPWSCCWSSPGLCEEEEEDGRGRWCLFGAT